MSNSFPGAASFDALEEQNHHGANWFHWIAGLSMVTALFQIGGGGLNFYIGLGATYLIAGVAGVRGQQAAPETAIVIKAIAIALCTTISAIFVGCGYYARRGHIWAYVAGMMLYLLDGLIFVGLAFLEPGLWINAAFHGFVLFNLFNGCKAAWALDRTRPAVVESAYTAEIEPL